MMHSDYYVYVYFRCDGSPCYVGKGRRNRLTHHAKYAAISNKHLHYLLRKGPLPVVKVRENLTDAQAIETEIVLIKAIGRKDLGLGPLFNLTDGGEGGDGAIRSEAQRKAKSIQVAAYHASMSDEAKKKRSENISKAVQQASTPEVRAKISKALSGKVHDAERRALTSRTVRLAYELRPELREQVGKRLAQYPKMAGKKHSEETKARMSASQNARFARERAEKITG